MRRHKQYILEWGSVSDTVEEISNKLSKKIWNDSKEKNVSLSDTYNIPFIEGEFDFKMFDGYIATVSYTFFLVDNMQQYNSIFFNNGGDESSNSWSDYDEKRINIVSGIINGYVSPDFFENVMHEVDHIFEYSMGMKKNTKFYDFVKDNLSNYDENVRLVSILIYYGFKHEQDAFVHQFYGRLLQEKYRGTFNDALLTLSEYKNYYQYFDIVFRKKEKSIIEKACSSIGISYNALRRHSKRCLKKFENKLFKAYTKYVVNSCTKNPIASFESKNAASNLILSEYKKRYTNIVLKNESYL